MKLAKTLVLLWCSGRDSNPQAFRHTPLKRTCLPVPPPERREGANFPQTATAGKCRFNPTPARAHARNRNRKDIRRMLGMKSVQFAINLFEQEQEHEHE